MFASSKHEVFYIYMRRIIWYNADEEMGEGIVLQPLMPKNSALLRKGEGCWSFHFFVGFVL